MVGLLTALPKTPLYERLAKEGRLLPGADGTDNTSIGTNFVPKQIEYDTLVREYRKLYDRLLSHRTIADRIANKMRYIGPAPYRSPYSKRQQVGIIGRFFWKGILRGGPSRAFNFMRTIRAASLRQIPLVISDWVAALSMKEFAERHLLIRSDARERILHDRLEAVRRGFRKYVQEGLVQVSIEPNHVSVRMEGGVDRAFYRKATRALSDLLDNTTSTVTLHVGQFHEEQRRHWKRLLRRLQSNGDRIYISASEKIKDFLEVDSSVFHLVLEPAV